MCQEEHYILNNLKLHFSEGNCKCAKHKRGVPVQTLTDQIKWKVNNPKIGFIHNEARSENSKAVCLWIAGKKNNNILLYELPHRQALWFHFMTHFFPLCSPFSPTSLSLCPTSRPHFFQFLFPPPFHPLFSPVSTSFTQGSRFPCLPGLCGAHDIHHRSPWDTFLCDSFNF